MTAMHATAPATRRTRRRDRSESPGAGHGWYASAGRTLAPFVLLALVACGGGPGEPDRPYAGLDDRPIKALSPEQVVDYLDGNGMGFALAAELNGHPGPRHVLDLASDLRLSADQRSATEAVFQAMQAEARRLGQGVVAREQELDRLFAADRPAEGDVHGLVREIGSLTAELRHVHLRAHLHMMDILTAEQVARYGELRGYGSDTGDSQAPDHDHTGGHVH